MNIGCCNNFILSTDAGMLLIQLRSGCQWRLTASGCSKLIPAEMNFICFSNSGKKYWWEEPELYEWQKMAGDLTNSFQHVQVGGKDPCSLSHPMAFTSQIPLFPTQFFVHLYLWWKALVLCMEVFISGTKNFEGNNKNATKNCKQQ
jgi:hypothetical protein